MALLDKLGVNLDQVYANEVEDQIKGNGLPAIGLHHAILEGSREVKANSGSDGYELRFKIIGGAARGLEVKESLWISDKERAKNRMLLFMHRLGLLRKVTGKDSKEHYVAVEGKSELSHCHGVECVIDIGEHEEYTSNGKKGTAARLSFEGVLLLTDKRCEKVSRGTPGLTTPSTNGNGTTANRSPSAQTQQSFDDI